MATIEPSPPPILSSQPAAATKPSPVPSSTSISPSPFPASKGLDAGHIVLIVFASIIASLILLSCIVEAYFRITGKPRPRMFPPKVPGDEGSTNGGIVLFGFGPNECGYSGGGCGS